MLPSRGIDNGEADAILRELRRREKEDNENFYNYELDPEGRLRNLFWSADDSRLDYLRHGDVVVVDTTFRTSRHVVTFVPIVGLNHHRAPVIFGCGVVSDQSLDSYVWLLRAFMLSTFQKGPKSVITDGGDAVVGAVRIMLPQSNHRICSWHVEQGIGEHLHPRPRTSSGRPCATTGARRRCSTSGGTASWRGTAPPRTRAGWTSCTRRGTCRLPPLGMANDQRTECLATSLHTGLHAGMSLLGLFEHADACTERLREEEAELDRQADISRVPLTTKHRYLEETAARLFTPANFYLLREEIKMIDG